MSDHDNLRTNFAANDALDIAAIILENGGTTAMAEHALEQVCQRVDQPAISMIWRMDCVSATFEENGRPKTFVRPIAPIGLGLNRAAEAAALSERAAKGIVHAPEFAAEIGRIRALPPAQSRWVVSAAAACAGAFFAMTMAADIGAFGVCTIASGAGQLLRSQLQALQIPRATVTFLCALLSGLIGTASLRFGLAQNAAPVLIGSMIYTVPGLLLINGFLDLTTERFIFIGIQRLLHAGFLFLIITVAVAIADALL